MKKLMMVALMALMSGCAVMHVEGKRADGAEWDMWHASLLWIRSVKTVDLANGTMGDYAGKGDGEAAGAAIGAAGKVLVTP